VSKVQAKPRKTRVQGAGQQGFQSSESFERVVKKVEFQQATQGLSPWGRGAEFIINLPKPSEIKSILHELKRAYIKCFRYHYEYAQDAFHLVLEFTSNECARIVLAKLLHLDDVDVGELLILPFNAKLTIFRTLVDKIREFKEGLKVEGSPLEPRYVYSGKYVNAVFTEFTPRPLGVQYKYERWYLHIKLLDVKIPYDRVERVEAFKELRTIYSYLNTCYLFASIYNWVMEKEFECKCESCGSTWIEKFREAYSNVITCPKCKHMHYIYSKPDDFFLYCKPKE